MPVVQLVIGIGDGDARLLQIANGACDVSRGHSVPRIVVEKDDEDAAMMAARGGDDEIVQVLEILVIPRQDGAPVTDGMSQVGLITDAGQSDVGGDLDIVPITAKQSDKARIDAVVVEVQPHMPNLARSSVERERGLPLRAIAGSFMPIASLKI